MHKQIQYSVQELSRIVLPALVALSLFIFSSFYLFLPNFEKRLVEERKIMLKQLIKSSWNMIQYIDKEVVSGTYSLKDAQKMAIHHLREMKYGVNDKDYFWINDFTPALIMHPYRPDMTGKNLADFTDPEGTKIFAEFVSMVTKNEEGYVSYMWQWKDEQNRIVPKLSFVKEYRPWGWIIGTGIYLEDVKEEVALMSRRLMVVSVIILLLVALIAWYQINQALNVIKTRQHAEAELLEYKDQLEETIKCKTEELENKNKELEILSATDSLTGLGNRRLFDVAIKNEWNRLARKNSPLSLLMCDIDMFKQYNDTYGHQQGDKCLKDVANMMKKHAKRSGELAIRYGGEEFCIILPNTEYSNAIGIANRIQKSVASLNIEHRTSTVCDMVTISVGVSTAKQIHKDWGYSLLVKTADRALYKAKNTGRNKVEGIIIDT